MVTEDMLSHQLELLPAFAVSKTDLVIRMRFDTTTTGGWIFKDELLNADQDAAWQLPQDVFKTTELIDRDTCRRHLNATQARASGGQTLQSVRPQFAAPNIGDLQHHQTVQWRKYREKGFLFRRQRFAYHGRLL